MSERRFIHDQTLYCKPRSINSLQAWLFTSWCYWGRTLYKRHEFRHIPSSPAHDVATHQRTGSKADVLHKNLAVTQDCYKQMSTKAYIR